MVALAVPTEQVAEFVIEKAKADPETRRLIEQVRKLEPLRNDPAWRALHDWIESKDDSFWGGIRRRQKRGEIVDQREIDYHRGYYAGALDLLEHPERVAENLEAAARHAYVVASQLEEFTTEQEKSPYA